MIDHVRRSILIFAGLAGGGILTGCTDSPRQFRSYPHYGPEAGVIPLNGWIALRPEGTVALYCGKSELGQRIHTTLTQLVAHECGVKEEQICLAMAPIDPLYGNLTALSDGLPLRPDAHDPWATTLRWIVRHSPLPLRFMTTGGSSSLRELWNPLRQAAATCRATLCWAAARRWQVETRHVELDDGRLHAPGGFSMELAQAIQLLGSHPRPVDPGPIPPQLPRRPNRNPPARLDTPPKLNGSARFGLDVREPGQVFAALTMAPWGATPVPDLPLGSFDSAGVLGTVQLKPWGPSIHRGLAVVATNWWQAHRTAQSLSANCWRLPAALAASNTTQWSEQRLERMHTDPGHTFWERGAPAAAWKAAARTLEAIYHTPYLAHAAMEPLNCTLCYQPAARTATVWIPTQVPDFVRRSVATVLGIAPAAVRVEVTLAGGAFGRRLEADVAVQAAQIAVHFPDRPIQLIWSREDEFQHDFYRPAGVARLRAGFTAAGEITVWLAHSAGPAIVPAYAERHFGWALPGPDKTTTEGSFDLPYGFANAKVSHALVDDQLPVGFWRSVGHSQQAFYVESFVDECAHALQLDPYTLRWQLLGDSLRQRTVLERLAQLSRWHQPLTPHSGQKIRARGLALHEAFGSVVGQVVQVLAEPSGQFRVEKVFCVIDCGYPLAQDVIEQQVSGAIVFGLSAALYGSIEVEQGQVMQSNFHDQPLLRLEEMPEVVVQIIPSLSSPQGVGEAAVPPLAPALANALFQATGKRLRSLPLKLGQGS